ncbi:MAG: hypothetical protein JJE04_17470 [Acidobacteriia bacterium]|nr:hypothetical protein [Terriglobia bacterium]
MSRVWSAENQSATRWPLLYTGVALTTLATLVLELSLTRIFSVVFFYHFAFLAISTAMFGLGAGGVLSYVVGAERTGLFRRLGILALWNSVAAVCALLFVLTRSGEMSNLTLTLVYLISAAPFILAGATVSLAISETIERVDRVYFFDLIGAAGGCLALVPLLNYLGGPNTVIAAGVLYVSAGAVWFTMASSTRGRMLAVVMGLALVTLTGYNAKHRLIDVRYAKDHELREESYVKWNSFSRIAIAPDRSRAMGIIIDADASTGIASFDFDHMSADERLGLLHQGPGFPYIIRPAAKTLIIGPGGGYDVARALASGSKDITGVEINPIIADTIMRGPRFRNMSRRIYFRPEVRIFVEDGRSFVRRSDEKYQVLQATLVDTWASTAAGAFALSENNLYTTEAFHDYLSHLTDDGLMAFTRWGFQPPRESLRLVTMAVKALQQLGEKEPWKHFLVGRENVKLIDAWGATDTVLISRKPFSDADVALARRGMLAAGMQQVYVPGDTGGNAFARFLRAPDQQAFLDQYPYDVKPVGDDRPFFFYTVQPGDLWNYLSTAVKESADFKINKAVPTLFNLVAVSILATLIMLALPPLVLGSRLPAGKGLRWYLLYFVFIGAGYILIQVALIQKFVLFLGHPTYALTVVIFAMLVSSGLGSYYSRGTDVAKALAAVALLVAVMAFLLAPVAQAGVGWPLWVRMLVSVLLVAPAGFAMGMPFPSGLARLEKMHKPSVRWAWSINAASSVLGSAMAILLALYLGLRATLLIGGLMYVCALLTYHLAGRETANV